MNEKLNFIFSRRSIRAYQNKPVEKEKIEDLMKAAMAAPSAVAKDPWHFIVIENHETKEQISQALPNGKMLASAPLGIIVCGDLNTAHSGQLSFLLQDCSAAIQNILLAANALGLGACWLGVHPREERINHIRKFFQLPDNMIPVCAISMGYPAEEKSPRTRYNQEKVHFESFLENKH